MQSSGEKVSIINVKSIHHINYHSISTFLNVIEKFEEALINLIVFFQRSCLESSSRASEKEVRQKMMEE